MTNKPFGAQTRQSPEGGGEASGPRRTRGYRVAVIPGDGVGAEVVPEAMRVVEAAASACGFALAPTPYDLGTERYLATGEVLPESVLDELTSHDAVLLGAVGDPRVPPGILETGLLLRLRRELDLYVNLRPARLFEGVPSPLAGRAEVDLTIVRENTEGLYSGRGQKVWLGTGKESATEMSVNTAFAVERIVRYAFDLASAQGRSLTLVHKTNVLERAGRLYSRIFEEIAGGYPDVPTAYQHVDAAAYFLVTDPARFSVLVTDNLFGDILSDLAAGLSGGLGFAGSGNIHPGRVSMFEPVHGSAPDIAGRGVANPIGAILAAALMLRHLGEDEAAARIEEAVANFAGKIATERLSTRGAGETIAGAVT